AETGFVQTLVRGANGQYAINQTFGLTAKPAALDVADIDGDGLADIVTANADPVAPAPGSALPVLSIFRNNGGSFNGGTPYQPEGASSARSVALIDVDNDGDRDIVSVNNEAGTTKATLLRIDTLGAGTPLSVGQTTVLPASNPIIATRGNLDGVGGEDLFLVTQSGGGQLTGSNEVKPFLGVAGLQGDLDGDGSVGPSDISILLLDFGPCPGTPCPSDLDGDGEVTSGDIAFLLLLFG
ncbi:MAG: FG-GAP-like repeat-containing protein, partial [Phycisphaerales bacterium]